MFAGEGVALYDDDLDPGGRTGAGRSANPFVYADCRPPRLRRGLQPRIPRSMAHSIEREIHISQPIASPARELSLNIFRTDQFLTQRLQEVLKPAEMRL